MSTDLAAPLTGARSPRRSLRADPAVRILIVAALLCVPLILLALRAPARERVLWDNLQWSVSAIGAALAAGWSVRGTSGRVRAVRTWAAIAFALWLASTLAWAWLNLAGTPTVPSIADLLTVAIVVPAAGLLVAAIRGRLSPAEEAAVLLDGALGLLLVGALVVYVFGPTALADQSAIGIAVIVYPTGFLTVGVAGLVGVLAVGYPLGRRGSAPMLLGGALVGLAYLTWIDPVLSLSDPGELSSILFTVGTLLAAYGAVTWRNERSRDERYLELARTVSRIVGPAFASVLFLLMLVPASAPIEDILHVLIFSGAILAILRQGLIVRERTAMLATVSALTEANRHLVRELRHDLEERIRQEEDTIRAERADAIETLSSNVGHEVNNPLTGVLGYAELLLAELPPDHRARADVEKIRDEALRARRILSSLRDYARPHVPRPRPTDLPPLLRAAVERASAAAGRSEVHVGLASPPMDPILTDDEALGDVLDHVLRNAFRAIRGSGRIEVSSGLAGDTVTIRIADDGIGMDPRTLRMAAEPLFSDWPDGGPPGSGLGLSISSGLVASHGGTITLDSVRGEGTTVEICLPVAGPPALAGRPHGDRVP